MTGHFWHVVSDISVAVGALATAVVAVFTYTLWKTTRGTLAQIEREYIANHRPQLRIRNVVVRLPTGRNAPVRLFAPGYLVSGQLYVVNVGDTAATITETGCWVKWSKLPLPMDRPYEGQDPQPFLRAQRLEPGASLPLPFQSVEVMGLVGEDLWLGNVGWKLWVMGWVAYTDDRKTPRRTAFCREYLPGPPGAPENGVFVAVNNPDYEHQE